MYSVVALIATVVPQRRGLSADDKSAVMFHQESYQDPDGLGSNSGIARDVAFEFELTATPIQEGSATLANGVPADRKENPI